MGSFTGRMACGIPFFIRFKRLRKQKGKDVYEKETLYYISIAAVQPPVVRLRQKTGQQFFHIPLTNNRKQCK